MQIDLADAETLLLRSELLMTALVHLLVEFFRSLVKGKPFIIVAFVEQFVVDVSKLVVYLCFDLVAHQNVCAIEPAC